MLHAPEKGLFTFHQELKECKGPQDALGRPLYFQHHLKLLYGGRAARNKYNLDYRFKETYLNGAVDKVDSQRKLWVEGRDESIEERICVNLADFNHTYSIQLGNSEPIRDVGGWTPQVKAAVNMILAELE